MIPLPRFAVRHCRRVGPAVPGRAIGDLPVDQRGRCGARTTSAGSGALSATNSGAADITTHSFRKTVATLIDDEGLSARIGADHLGHSKVSMTQDRYMARNERIPRSRTCWTGPSA